MPDRPGPPPLESPPGICGAKSFTYASSLGKKYCVGEFVEVRSDDESSRPWIARISQFRREPNGDEPNCDEACLSHADSLEEVACEWVWHPRDTVAEHFLDGVDPYTYGAHEVFLGDGENSVDWNSVDSIKHKVEVLPLPEYMTLAANRFQQTVTADGANDGGSRGGVITLDPERCWYYRQRLDPDNVTLRPPLDAPITRPNAAYWKWCAARNIDPMVALLADRKLHDYRATMEGVGISAVSSESDKIETPPTGEIPDSKASSDRDGMPPRTIKVPENPERLYYACQRCLRRFESVHGDAIDLSTVSETKLIRMKIQIHLPDMDFVCPVCEMGIQRDINAKVQSAAEAEQKSSLLSASASCPAINSTALPVESSSADESGESNDRAKKRPKNAATSKNWTKPVETNNSLLFDEEEDDGNSDDPLWIPTTTLSMSTSVTSPLDNERTSRSTSGRLSRSSTQAASSNTEVRRAGNRAERLLVIFKQAIDEFQRAPAVGDASATAARYSDPTLLTEEFLSEFEIFTKETQLSAKMAQQKLHELFQNLKRSNNEPLRRRVISGELSLADLIRADAKDLAPESLKRKREVEAEKYFKEQVLIASRSAQKVLRKTHKGLEVVQDEEGGATGSPSGSPTKDKEGSGLSGSDLLQAANERLGERCSIGDDGGGDSSIEFDGSEGSENSLKTKTASQKMSAAFRAQHFTLPFPLASAWEGETFLQADMHIKTPPAHSGLPPRPIVLKYLQKKFAHLGISDKVTNDLTNYLKTQDV